jgi:hypothetical protein
MQMVASNNPDLGRGAAPRSGDSDGGSKGKRKADASLDTWMAMHKSLDLDLDLPSNLGMDSMPASGSGGSGAGPRTIVGSMLPMLGISSLDPPNSVLPGGGGNAAGGSGGGGGTSVPFAEFLATVQQQRAQQRAQLESKLGAPSAAPSAMNTSPASGGGAVGGGAGAGPHSGSGGSNGLPPRSGPPISTESNSQLMTGGTGIAVPDTAPAVLPSTVTMGQLRDMFSKAVRQEIPFTEVENFLQSHGLVDNRNENALGTSGGGGAPGDAPAAAPPAGTAAFDQGFAPGLDQSGLEDMRSMEDDLPAYGKAQK